MGEFGGKKPIEEARTMKLLAIRVKMRGIGGIGLRSCNETGHLENV